MAHNILKRFALSTELNFRRNGPQLVQIFVHDLDMTKQNLCDVLDIPARHPSPTSQPDIPARHQAWRKKHLCDMLCQDWVWFQTYLFKNLVEDFAEHPRRCLATWQLARPNWAIGPIAAWPKFAHACMQFAKYIVGKYVFGPAPGLLLGLELEIQQWSMPDLLAISLDLESSTRILAAIFFCKIQVDFVWMVILAFFLWLWNLPQILSVDPAALSPHETSETATHNNARRSGLTLGCELSYHDLPLCTGHDDDGTPVVEMKPWPFLLPNKMVWGLLSRLQFALNLSPISCSLGLMFFSIPFAMVLEAQALLDDGFLDILADLSKLDEYWAICFRSTLHILQLRINRDLFQSCYMATCHIHQKLKWWMLFLSPFPMSHLGCPIILFVCGHVTRAIKKNVSDEVMRAKHSDVAIWSSIGSLNWHQEHQILHRADFSSQRSQVPAMSMRVTSTSLCNVLASTFATHWLVQSSMWWIHKKRTSTLFWHLPSFIPELSLICLGAGQLFFHHDPMRWLR